MVFAREAGVATILVSITLWVQCAGMAVLIRLARAYLARSKNGLSPWRAGVHIVRFSAAMIVLHIVQILLWGRLLSLALSSNLGILLLFFRQ
jgi:hypothetical protein